MSVVVDISQPVIEPPIVELAAPPAFQPRLWRLTVDQYHEMLRHGILSESDDVELLDGILVAKMTKGTAHNVAVMLVHAALSKYVPAGWFAVARGAATLPASEPEPDVMVIPGQPRDYLQHHPLPGEVALIVEVSESSLRHDRRFKKAIYAAAGLPLYWIVNLVDRRVEMYADPTGPHDQPDFRRRRRLRRNRARAGRYRWP